MLAVRVCSSLSLWQRSPYIVSSAFHLTRTTIPYILSIADKLSSNLYREAIGISRSLINF